METNVRSLIVGSFILVLFIGILGFVLWFSKTSYSSDYRYYYVYFDDATGLILGSPVKYRGINIGEIDDITLDLRNIQRVRVRIGIDKRIILKSTVTASLDRIGITGIVYLRLSGGKPDDPELKALNNEKMLIIPSKETGISEILAQAPNLLKNVNNLVNRLGRIFSDKNQNRIEQILYNLDVLVYQLADNKDGFPKLQQNANQTILEIQKLAKSLAEIKQPVESTLSSIDQSASSIRNLSDETQVNLNSLLFKLDHLVDGLNNNGVDYLLSGQNQDRIQVAE